MNIPFISKWLRRNEVKVYIADFITLEMRKARIQAIRQQVEDYRKAIEQDHRD
jgi:hypothetical protein